MILRHGAVTAYLFPAVRLGAVALVSGSNIRRIHGSLVLSETKAAATLDGSMYTDIGSGLARGRFLLYDQQQRLSIPSRAPSDGMTISVREGIAHASSGSTVFPGSTVAVQLYPELVRSGRNVANPARDASSDWRAALGIFRDGRLGFAVGIASMRAFASDLRAMGFTEAGYTDGGDSTLLAFEDGQWIGDPHHRAVATWLIDRGESEQSSGITEFLISFGIGWLVYHWSRNSA